MRLQRPGLFLVLFLTNANCFHPNFSGGHSHSSGGGSSSYSNFGDIDRFRMFMRMLHQQYNWGSTSRAPASSFQPSSPVQPAAPVVPRGGGLEGVDPGLWSQVVPSKLSAVPRMVSQNNLWKNITYKVIT